MEFNTVRLGEIADILGGYAFKSADFLTKGIPVVKIKNITPPMVNLQDSQFVSEEVYREKIKYALTDGDILISMTGSNFNQIDSAVGKVGRFHGNQKALLNQRVGKIFVTQPNIYDEDFLYYVLSQKEIQYELASSASGSANQANINPNLIKQLQVPIPSLNEQKKIKDFLLKISGKINLNKELIQNLEIISQTLFKHWFIDFEFPNEEGKPYKSSEGEMVESELGEIPKGWDILKLSDITTLLKKTFNPSKTEVTEVLHFSLPAFDKNQLPTLDEVSTIKSNKWIIEENCVVFSKMNPKTPRIWLTNINEKMINVASSEFVVLQSKTVEENSFIYSLCKSNSFNEYLISNATGSTNSRQRVTPTIALSYKFPLSREIMKLYGSTIVGISEKIKDLYKECETLQQLRDTLLPKLLSGEIEIPDDLEV